MSSVREKLLEKSKLPQYKDELFCSLDDDLFIIYDDKIAKREEPDPRQGLEILKVSLQTAQFLDDFCKENETTIAELNQLLEDCDLDVDSPEETLAEEELNPKAATFLKLCMEKEIEIESIIRAMEMLLQGCEPGVWYLEIDDFIGIVSSVAEFGEILDFSEEDEERDSEWESVIDDLESYVFDDGEVL